MKKYFIYLSERFPLQSHIPIIAIFSFSAICYSLLATEASSFIGIFHFVLAFVLTFGLFLLLRISDEFKDYEEDKKFRKYLPIPRGLLTLNHLKLMAAIVFISHLIILITHPQFIIIYIICLIYLSLMYKEFFIKKWLKQNQLAYVLSHMAIIPLVDLVASSAHWSFCGISPPTALGWFFAVSFFNGILMEIGRKIKLPKHEEKGVLSYSKLWGTHKAIVNWLLILLLTLSLAVAAAYAITSPVWVYWALAIWAILCALPAVLCLKHPTQNKTKLIEKAAGLWTMGMYLNLGALPFLIMNYEAVITKSVTAINAAQKIFILHNF